jgi:hypothetical protein
MGRDLRRCSTSRRVPSRALGSRGRGRGRGEPFGRGACPEHAKRGRSPSPVLPAMALAAAPASRFAHTRRTDAKHGDSLPTPPLSGPAAAPRRDRSPHPRPGAAASASTRGPPAPALQRTPANMLVNSSRHWSSLQTHRSSSSKTHVTPRHPRADPVGPLPTGLCHRSCQAPSPRSRAAGARRRAQRLRTGPASAPAGPRRSPRPPGAG